MIVENRDQHVVLNDVLSGITVAIRPLAYHSQRCPKFQDTGFQRIVSGEDVLQLKVGVANHVEQHKGMGRLNFCLAEVFSPSLRAEGVILPLVFRIVPKQDHIVAEVHGRDVPSEFNENRCTAGCIVCPGNGQRPIGCIEVPIGECPGIVMCRNHNLSVGYGGVRCPSGVEVGEVHTVTVVLNFCDVPASWFKQAFEVLSKVQRNVRAR